MSSQPPQLPNLPFVLRRSNAVRRKAANARPAQLSSMSSMQASTKSSTEPEQLVNNSRKHQHPPARNFSLPTHHAKQPRTMARYYAFTLSSNDKVALARGDKNHNLKSWTPKDLILFEETRKDLAPANT